MSIVVKEIIKEDFSEMVKIQQSAYASSFKGTSEERDELSKIFEELTAIDDITAYGAYKNGVLVGCVLYYTFETNFHGEIIKSAGIGSLAVDLLYKKEKVAQHLIQHSFELTQKQNINLYTLYPFSIRFYRSFGFGYGTPIHTYHVAPEDFKDFSNKHLLSYGTEDDLDDIFEFYNACAETTHGMSKKTSGDKRRLRVLKKGRIILAKLNDELIGYMVYSQQGLSDTNKQTQKMIIHEMVYSKREALLAFSSFFNGQKDQITYIEVFTFDKSFYHLINNINFVSDPKTMEIISLKAADHALGLMYYAVNPEGLLKHIKNRTTQHICFNIIYPKTRITKPCSINEPNSNKVEITLKLNEFSSWIVGATSLKELYNHGQLETNRPEALKQLDYEFNFNSPISYTRF